MKLAHDRVKGIFDHAWKRCGSTQESTSPVACGEQKKFVSAPSSFTSGPNYSCALKFLRNRKLAEPDIVFKHTDMKVAYVRIAHMLPISI